jgi:hypothetical protein
MRHVAAKHRQSTPMLIVSSADPTPGTVARS